MTGRGDVETEPIVIDNGSWMVKAGFAGDKTARAYERSVLGRSIEDDYTIHYGDRAISGGDHANLTNIMKRGEVNNWEDMERFWEYVFETELRTNPEDKYVLITEIPFNCPQNRKKIVEIFMEKFKVRGLYITDPASLALISSGRMTGIAVDFGGEVTHVSALIKGKSIQTENQSRRIDFGGNDVTKLLACELQRENNLLSQDSLIDVETYKHWLFTHDFINEPQDTFTLPNGISMNVTEAHKQTMDLVLVPKSMDCQSIPTVEEVIKNILTSCDKDTSKDLKQNIILAGGASMSRGVEEKLRDKLIANGIPPNLKIVAPPERRKSTWLGGSIIASLDEFQTKMCKSRQYYQESGWEGFTSFDYSAISHYS